MSTKTNVKFYFSKKEDHIRSSIVQYDEGPETYTGLIPRKGDLVVLYGFEYEVERSHYVYGKTKKDGVCVLLRVNVYLIWR